MFCERCGAALPDNVNFCPDCGWKIPQNEQPPDHPLDTPPDPTKKQDKKPGKFGTIKSIISLILLIGVIVAIVYSIQRHPVSDLKDIVFDEYGSETLGDAVSKSMINVSWDTEKISKTKYQVTLTGFNTELYSDLALVFNLTYGNDRVYAKFDHLLQDGEYCDDYFSMALALSAIYGDG